MKKASKTLAVLLSVLLLFSFGTTVFADETSAPDFDAASSSTESSAEPSDEPSAAPETSESSESSEVSAPESAEPETSGTESSSTESSEESAVTETKVQTYANTGEEPVAKIGETPYASLQEAVNAASASDQATTITLVADIADIHASDIVTIPSEANLTLDMNEKKITVASDFMGRPLINEGTLTITGNGTIDSSASDTKGYGAVDNYGVLTIENGTFTGSVNASGASIKNRPDATLTIYDGLSTVRSPPYIMPERPIFTVVLLTAGPAQAAILAVGVIRFKVIWMPMGNHRNYTSMTELLSAFRAPFPLRPVIPKFKTVLLKQWLAATIRTATLLFMHCISPVNLVKSKAIFMAEPLNLLLKLQRSSETVTMAAIS